MRKQANRWLVAVFLLFFIFSGIHMTAFGEEPAKDPLAQLEEEMGIGEEIQRIQEYLDGLRPEGRTVSLTDLMQVIIQGNMKEIVNTAGKLLEDALFSQAKEGQALLVQVAVLGLTGAVFSHAASAFKGSQIPETAFYMIYLLIFTCLAGSFLSSIQITAQVLDQILEFVRLLMPAYFISVAFAGGSTSAAAFYEIALGAAWAVQWLCRQVFLSIVRVYGLLVLGDHMMEEPFFSKMTELMEKIVSWGLRSILGLKDLKSQCQSQDTGTSDPSVTGTSLCGQCRQICDHEICGNDTGVRTGNRCSGKTGVWKQCTDQKQSGSSGGPDPGSDHVGTGCEAGCFNGHVSGCSGSFAACL